MPELLDGPHGTATSRGIIERPIDHIRSFSMTCDRAYDRPADVNRALLQALLLHYLELVDPHLWPGVDGLTVDDVLKGYAQAVAAGQAPGAAELLRRHPEF